MGKRMKVFRLLLQELVEGIDGGLAATVMGTDGIAVERYPEASSGCDVETVGVEYTRVVDEIKHASKLLTLGEVEEVSVATAGTKVLLRMVTQEYYIAFVVDRSANVGKARYFLRRAAAKAREEISG